MSYTDYIYKTQDDMGRVRIEKRENGWWATIFKHDGSMINYNEKCAEVWSRKKDLKKQLENEYGELESINPDTVTEGWEYE